jgi:hypothetical protein
MKNPINTTSMLSLYGETNSKEAYNLRDFLQRSVVDFNWIELFIICSFYTSEETNDEDSKSLGCS